MSSSKRQGELLTRICSPQAKATALPRAVQSAIDSRLKLFEDRIASLLYKQTVEMDMAMSIVLQSLNVSEEVLRQERAKSIAAVKRTNGQLRMEQKLRDMENDDGKADRQKPVHQVRRWAKRRWVSQVHRHAGAGGDHSE